MEIKDKLVTAEELKAVYDKTQQDIIDISASFVFNSSVSFTNSKAQVIYNPATRTISGNISFYGSTNIGTSTNILTIAEAYRPKSAFTPCGMLYANNSSQWYPYYFNFAKNGTVRQPFGSAVQRGYCSFTYQI